MTRPACVEPVFAAGFPSVSVVWVNSTSYASRTAADDPIGARLTAAGAPFELAAHTIGGVVYRVFRHAPGSLRDIYVGARQFGPRPFLVGRDFRVTYAEACGQAAALVRALSDEGIVKGRRVAIAMANGPEWVISFLAVTAMGATAVLVNNRGSPEELFAALTDTDCAMLIADAGVAARVPGEWIAHRPVVVTGSGMNEVLPPAWRQFDDLVRGGETLELEPVETSPDDEAVVIFTSGTTGGPKGALLTQRATAQSVTAVDYLILRGPLRTVADLAALQALPEAPPPSVMLVFPLFHASGATSALLPAMRRGGKIVMVRKWNVAEVIDLIEREQVSGLSGSPAMLWDLMHADRSGRDLRSLRFLSVAGQGLRRPLFEDLRRYFPDVLIGVGYGQSETGGVTGIGGANLAEHPDCAGWVLPYFELRLLDDAGKEVPAGEMGEILLRSPTVMREYCGRPAETAAVLEDGWLRTGDLGRVDDEGRLYIVDRKKNIVISGGENITCSEVESAALTHPAVREAVAFGVPDERLGERLVLAVVMRPGMSVTPRELADYIGERRAIYKVPRDFTFITELPLNATGKVDKRKLLAGYLQRQV